MTTNSAAGEVFAGIDTHSRTHHVAVIDVHGSNLGDREFPATAAGYAAIIAFICAYGTVVRVGVEGTGSYGAGLSRALRGADLNVAEVIRPKRAERRHGKSDPMDAYAAARAALADTNLPTPKTGDGPVEQIRVLLMVRRSAVKARTAAAEQISSLLTTAPEPLRQRWLAKSTATRVSGMAASRPDTTTASIDASYGQMLKRLAHRYQQLAVEVTAIDADLTHLITALNPALATTHGIGTTTAAQLLVTAGDNPERMHSEAAFAALCGAAPIPASSGLTTRYRLSRGGDRHANCALHHIVLTRTANDARTQTYIQRRTAEGKTGKEIRRCLKRAVAREVWHLLVNPPAIPTIDDLKPLRLSLAITQTAAAAAVNTSTGTLSRLENGHHRNDELATRYRTWLHDQQTQALPT